jgi:8-hydroxy-5-deazaflavin:NADPH oxidoreductase
MTAIAVLGAGHIGGILAGRWVQAGHTVTVGLRSPETEAAEQLRSELGERGRVVGLSEMSPVVAQADAVVFSVPGGAMQETIAKLAPALRGRVVIDAANRMGDPIRNSLAAFREQVPELMYARAFNSLGWENFAEPDFDGIPADLLYAGPGESENAGKLVVQLIGDIGLRPVRLGESEDAGLVDTVADLWFALAIRRQHGRHLAFKVLGI